MKLSLFHKNILQAVIILSLPFPGWITMTTHSYDGQGVIQRIENASVGRDCEDT